MKFLDFFAGIGGFRLGMEMAGHECVGHCEIDEAANRSYIAMHRPKENEWYARDITTVKPNDLPAAEVYCFGFPCQAFSLAGNRRGFEDTRGTLIFEVLRLVKVRHPDLLFAENVKGLLNHDNGRTFGTIIRTMDELGYDVEWQLCNSKHFGIPQNRERVFIIGHLRNGRCRRKILPLDTCYTDSPELQGFEGIVANTIEAKDRNARGVYIIPQRERESTVQNTQSKRIPQNQRWFADYRSDEGLRIRYSGECPTLTARSGGGLPHDVLLIEVNPCKRKV